MFVVSSQDFFIAPKLDACERSTLLILLLQVDYGGFSKMKVCGIITLKWFAANSDCATSFWPNRLMLVF